MKKCRKKLSFLVSVALMFTLILTYSTVIAATGAQFTPTEVVEESTVGETSVDTPAPASTAEAESQAAASQEVASQDTASQAAASQSTAAEPALASLTVGRGTLSPSFSSGVRQYTITPSSGSDVHVVAKPASGCTVNNGDFTLPPGGTFTIKVSNGSKTVSYTIKVGQPSNSTVSSISSTEEGVTGDVILPISEAPVIDMPESQDDFLELPEESSDVLGGGLIINSSPEAPPIVGDTETVPNKGGDVNWFLIIAIVLIVLAIGAIIYVFREQIINGFTKRGNAYNEGGYEQSTNGSYDKNDPIDDGFDGYDGGNGYTGQIPYYGQQQEYPQQGGYQQQNYYVPQQTQQQYAPPPAGNSYAQPGSNTYSPPARYPQRPQRRMNQNFTYEDEDNYQVSQQRPVRRPPPPPSPAQKAALEGYTAEINGQRYGVHTEENPEPVQPVMPPQPKYAIPSPQKPIIEQPRPEAAESQRPKPAAKTDEEESVNDIDWNDFFQDRKR